MALEKVAAGQPFRPRAEDWNAFVDAALDHRARRHGLGGRAAPLPEHAITVLLRNCSGGDQPQSAVLWIDELAVRPDDPEGEQRFRTRAPVFDGRLHADAVASRRECLYAVLREPLRSGAVGPALVFGVTPARIEVADEAHDRAEPDRAVPARLRSGWAGSCRILWKQPGTGLKWAVVHFPVHEAPRLLVANAGTETILDGYACVADGAAADGPWRLRAVRPAADSRLDAFAYGGPDLPAGATAVLHAPQIMRFRIDPAGVAPGDFVGTRAGSWLLSANRFGFLVLAVEPVQGAAYAFAYCRHAAVPPILRAVADANPAAGTIAVRRVGSDGAPVGTAFTLDVIPEP